MYSNIQISEIFNLTSGHCHFCGDPIELKNDHKTDDSDGAWGIDHIIQKGKGGIKDTTNCLAACVKCNRLHWHRTGQSVRNFILYRLVAKDEITKGCLIGKKLEELKEKRPKKNSGRRR